MLIPIEETNQPDKQRFFCPYFQNYLVNMAVFDTKTGLMAIQARGYYAFEKLNTALNRYLMSAAAEGGKRPAFDFDPDEELRNKFVYIFKGKISDILDGLVKIFAISEEFKTVALEKFITDEHRYNFSSLAESNRASNEDDLPTLEEELPPLETINSKPSMGM